VAVTMQSQPFSAAASSLNSGGACTTNRLNSTEGEMPGASLPSQVPIAGASARR
jgi:hypothetical protein